MGIEIDREISRQPNKRKKSLEVYSPVGENEELEGEDPSAIISSPDIPPSAYFRPRLSLANQACWYLGFLLFATAAVGFVAPNLAEFHFSYSHNMLNLVMGVLTLWVGLTRKGLVAKRYCLAAGLAYFLFGAAGYLFGKSLYVDGAEQARYVLTVVPGKLVLGRWDHYLHATIGSLLLLAGIFSKSKRTYDQGPTS